MNRFSVLLLSCLGMLLPLWNVGAQSGGEENSALTAAFERLSQLEQGQPLESLVAIEQAVSAAQADAELRTELEGRLVEVLESDATDLAKDYSCRQLSMIGSEAALPVLARLLVDPRLSYMARYAVEQIDGPAARATLREILAKTDGGQRIGAVISLGRLSDVDAAPAIVLLLDEPDTELREAALVALGRIGSETAAEGLREFQRRAPSSLRDQVADALLAAAESLRQQGLLDQAEEIYRSLLTDTGQHTVRGAYRGLILVRPERIPAKIRAGLASDEDWQREVAADCLVDLDRHIGAVASAIVDLPSAGKMAALWSLRNHGDAAVREAALQCLEDPENGVRTAALAALVTSGTSEDVPRLARLVSKDPHRAIRAAASRTLRQMPAEGVDRALIRWMDDTENVDAAIVRCVLQRRCPQTVPALLRAAESRDSETRKEAFAALELMASADQLPAMIALLCKAPPGQEQEAASRAVWMACQRAARPANCKTLLLAALDDADPAGRCALLPTLARIGGDEALAAVERAMQSDDVATRDAGYRALANWPDATVADRLLEIAKTNNSDVYRVWALRAYARVVALPDPRPPSATFDMLREAMDLATRTDERELIVSRMATVRVPEALALMQSLLDESELRDAAAAATFELAKGLSRSHPQQAREALQHIEPMITDPEILQQIPKVLREIEARGAKQN